MDPTKPYHNSCFANMNEAAPRPSPSFTDLMAQRSISESVLSRARNRYGLGGSSNSIIGSPVHMMVLHRSGGSQVKQAIDGIRERCQVQEADPTNHVKPPEDECCILAQCAVDAYYRVVIAGRGGIPVIVQAMRTFPHERDLQECCCLALGNLCTSSSNLIAVDYAGGVNQVIVAMKNHSQSVAVQSAACDALRNMSGLILQLTASPSSAVSRELIEVLSHTKTMCLLPTHRSVAESLLRAIRSTQAIGQR